MVSENEKTVSQFLTDFHQILTLQRCINFQTFDRSDFFKLSTKKKLLRLEIRLFFWQSLTPNLDLKKVVRPDQETVIPFYEHMKKSLIQNGIHSKRTKRVAIWKKSGRKEVEF